MDICSFYSYSSIYCTILCYLMAYGPFVALFQSFGCCTESNYYFVPYSLRLLLHKTPPPEYYKPAPHMQSLEHEEINASRSFVEGLLEKSLAKLEEKELGLDHVVRWELGACWIQHLQDQKNTGKDKKPPGENAKNEMKVEGLGTNLRSLRNNRKKTDGSNLKGQFENSRSNAEGVIGEAEHSILPSIESQLETNAKENELAMKRVLSEAAFARLKETETGLHCKVKSCTCFSRAYLSLFVP